jgi:DNA-binding beta-propeller fold protein YncE
MTTGSTFTPPEDYLTLAYDASNGSLLWQRRYNGPDNLQDQAIAIAASPDSSALFVTGSSKGNGTEFDYATVSYDATTGFERWVSRYAGACYCADMARGLAASTDGSTLFVTGDGYGPRQYDFHTIAYDTATGSTRWTARSDVKGRYDSANFIVAASDGSTIFVTGWSGFGVGQDEDWLTIAYNAMTGGELWRRRLRGASASNDTPEGAAISTDGSRLYVTGRTWPGIFTTYLVTVAYDTATGSVLWRIHHKGEGCCIVGSPIDSTIYVSQGGRNERAVAAFDGLTGALLWVVPDTSGRLALSPDGARVFVVGTVAGSAGDNDFLIAAYET